MSLAEMTHRATSLVDRRLPRRSFVARSAVIATALATTPADLLLRPKSAYAAVCSCSGSSCACGSLCCDGYTEFCCTLTGANSCPEGSVVGGWWKVDGSSFCGNGPRFYMDCHRPCGSCSCGSNGVCAGACNGTSCGCANGSCGNRKAGCTQFRYGNCGTTTRCLGPIQCRVVTCRAPWEVDASCTTAVRVDERTRSHNRPCLQDLAVQPIVGDWSGFGRDGVGVYWHATRKWQIKNDARSGAADAEFGFGGPGDLPVVGDWTGSGRDGIGVFRPSTREWFLRNTYGGGGAHIEFGFGGPGDVPVVGDWDGDGIDGIGVYRPSTGKWYLRQTASGGGTHVEFGFGGPGDVPVVGDWDGDGIDGIGVFRPSTRTFYLRQTASGGGPHLTFGFGGAGDLPLIGDWVGGGPDEFGVFRPFTATWFLRSALGAGGVDNAFTFGPRSL